MPTARKTGWKIRAGTVTSSSLTDSYLVTALTVQSDQNDATPWYIDSAGTTTPTPARITTNADLSRSPDGFLAWQWRMSYMTSLMTDFWLDSFLPDSVWSAPVTVLTYDESDVAMYIQATLNRPNFPGSDVQYAAGGWANVIWRFTAGVQIAPP